jgi:hypothetical protein
MQRVDREHMTRGARQFVNDHQWDRTLAPLRACARTAHRTHERYLRDAAVDSGARARIDPRPAQAPAESMTSTEIIIVQLNNRGRRWSVSPRSKRSSRR